MSAKRSVDFELNLIPFIDLMSVMISFLLITAIWTRVDGIDAQQAPVAAGEPDSARVEDTSVKLGVRIQQDGYVVTAADELVEQIGLVNGEYDTRALDRVLGDLRDRYPETVALQVACEDSVAYEALIRVMDLALARQLRALSVGGV